MLINSIVKENPLNLYFFNVRSDKFTGSQFGMHYTPEELLSGVIAELNTTVNIDVLGCIPMKDLISIIEQKDLKVKIPMKLKKREFINNLMYTKDTLVKDEKDKIALNKILSRI